MSTQKIDVLAVLAHAADRTPTLTLGDKVREARAAVAELIEADRELDAAVDAYSAAHVFSLGEREYVSPDDPAVVRLDAAKDRRAAALARIGGAA